MELSKEIIWDDLIKAHYMKALTYYAEYNYREALEYMDNHIPIGKMGKDMKETYKQIQRKIK